MRRRTDAEALLELRSSAVRGRGPGKSVTGGAAMIAPQMLHWLTWCSRVLMRRIYARVCVCVCVCVCVRVRVHLGIRAEG